MGELVSVGVRVQRKLQFDLDVLMVLLSVCLDSQIDCLGTLMEPTASSNMHTRWVEATQ